ncbi:MAG: uroporphyrinogen decarboxylase family protein [Candidatus Firestonebacteria bacterium]
MNNRERYINTLLFEKSDKIPFTPGGGRESTIERWESEGLPKGKDQYEALCDILGIKIEKTKPKTELGVKFNIWPDFEQKVLKHENGHYIVQDWKGTILEISDEFSIDFLKSRSDFVTRKYHKFPVENEQDWAEMKKRLDPDAHGRFPEDFAKRCKEIKERDYIISINPYGPFWALRDFCGFENICMFTIEKPDLVKEMAEVWGDFILKVVSRVLDNTSLDVIHISEDMAYKEKSMISPAMCREFLMPEWKKWVKAFKGEKCPVIAMDSDGFIEELIPLWIESGIQACDPIEVAAGCDINRFRKLFGKKIAYRGGVDKREIAKGGKRIEAELKRIEPVVKDGGYIPGCDHAIPADVSWKDFVHYGGLLAEMTGWK